MRLPFRRERPLHERLAEQGGLAPARTQPLDTRPRWGEVGIHGVHRQREWDAVATADAPGLPGARLEFVSLPDGTLLVDEDIPDDALAPLADAVEEETAPPYRAEAVRQHEDVWAVAARRIEVVRVEDEVDGDRLELAVAEGERTFLVDGRPAFGSVPALERLAAERFEDYVVRGERLEDELWEVAVTPL
ncbi:MAG: hypothetical protein ICV64_05825 [Thermoleophilia bacterium]|nr:hypothetical protein [Thermoleophilia bacterium]